MVKLRCRCPAKLQSLLVFHGWISSGLWSARARASELVLAAHIVSKSLSAQARLVRKQSTWQRLEPAKQIKEVRLVLHLRFAGEGLTDTRASAQRRESGLLVISGAFQKSHRVWSLLPWHSTCFVVLLRFVFLQLL